MSDPMDEHPIPTPDQLHHMGHLLGDRDLDGLMGYLDQLEVPDSTIIMFLARVQSNLLKAHATSAGVDPSGWWYLQGPEGATPPLAVQLVVTMANEDRGTFVALLNTVVDDESGRGVVVQDLVSMIRESI